MDRCVCPSPVAAGNVETSQRLVDTIYLALSQALPNRIPAASAGTMNNVLFGGRHSDSNIPFVHYETIEEGPAPVHLALGYPGCKPI